MGRWFESIRAHHIYMFNNIQLKKQLKSFLKIYNTRPIKDNSSGMRIDHCFAVYCLLKKIKPKNVIESGIWRGQTTWLIKKTLKKTMKIIDFSMFFAMLAKCNFRANLTPNLGEQRFVMLVYVGSWSHLGPRWRPEPSKRACGTDFGWFLYQFKMDWGLILDDFCINFESSIYTKTILRHLHPQMRVFFLKKYATYLK